MDHLLRNRRLGHVLCPSLHPFFRTKGLLFTPRCLAPFCSLLYFTADGQTRRMTQGECTRVIDDQVREGTAVQGRLGQRDNAASFASIVVRNVKSCNMGALALTVTVAPRLK